MTTRRTPALISALALAAAVSPIAAGSASAMHPRNYKVRISISDNAPALHGKLHSQSTACSASRTVRAFMKRPGQDKKLGKATSNSAGHWAFRITPVGQFTEPGKYYARTRGETVSGDATCKAARSKVLTIESAD